MAPSGTGKSQTITDFIATPTARGKKLVSVAEKRAALEVVVARFEDISVSDIYSKENLGPESYIQPGHPCHGGYEDVDPDRQ